MSKYYAILLLMLVPFTAGADEEDDFEIIDAILGRSSNALATRWQGSYFGGSLIFENAIYRYEVDSLVNSGDSNVSGNTYPSVVANAVNPKRQLLAVVIGKNYVDGNFLYGVEGLFTSRIGAAKESEFGSNLWITTQESLDSEQASSKGTRTESDFSDSEQTNVYPQGGFSFNTSLEARFRMGYVDNDLYYYGALGYVVSNWYARARANVATVFISTGSDNAVISVREVFQGISVAMGVEYALTASLFGRLELISYTYPSVSTQRDSNAVSFNLKQKISTTQLATTFVYNFR